MQLTFVVIVTKRLAWKSTTRRGQQIQLGICPAHSNSSKLGKPSCSALNPPTVSGHVSPK